MLVIKRIAHWAEKVLSLELKIFAYYSNLQVEC